MGKHLHYQWGNRSSLPDLTPEERRKIYLDFVANDCFGLRAFRIKGETDDEFWKRLTEAPPEIEDMDEITGYDSDY